MNAIPQRAHNYERIQIPRNIPTDRNKQPKNMGRITDMQAYNMQKRALQRQKAYEERMAYEAQKRLEYEEEMFRQQQRKEFEAQYYRQQQRKEMEQQRREQQMRARAAAQRELDFRQTNVKNIVGGRKLTPAYEVGVVAAPASGAREYVRRNNSGARRVAANGAYGYEHVQTRRKPIHGFDMVDSRRAEDTNSGYAGIKPIAVENEAFKKKGIVSTIILIALIFAVLAGIVIRYAQISDINLKNAQAEARIESLSQDLDKVKVEVALQEDLGTIRQRAVSELNMSEPQDSQIVYLPAEADQGNVDAAAQTGAQQADAAAVQTDAAAGDTQAKTTIVDTIKDFFNTIIETVKGWFRN
ncbi:MAG: hypothetical protein VB082_00940 [Christensenella sp.]|nr:hypothetical protein [Christensenella sp.]